MYRFKSINIKISLITIMILTVIMVISSLVIYFEFRSILLKRIIDGQKSVMVQNKINVENLANGVNQVTTYLYTDKTIARILTKSSGDNLQKTTDVRELHEQFANYATTPIVTNLSIYFAALYINDNFPISKELEAYSLGGPTNSLSGIYNTKEVHNKKWFTDTVKMNGALNTFNIPEDKSRVYIARLIRNQNISDAEYSDIVGVVVIGVDIKSFEKQIEASKLTKSTQIILANRDGKIIYSNDQKMVWEDITKNHLTSSINDYDNAEPFDVTNGKQRYITTVYSLHWGWRLISMIPYADILEGLDIIGEIIIVTSIAGLIIGVILTLVLSNTISKPIRKLAKTMNEIRNENNMNIHMETKYRDEVGVLYRNFNNMMKRINNLVADVYESSTKQRKAELKALQAQINPHFVYNTLDAVNWLALSKNEDDIAEMVSSLAYIFRYSIKNPDEKVKLEEEIEHVRRYIKIQSIRYPNIFDVEYIIENEIMNCIVPKFIIQPLVENAIIHGIKKGGNQGMIVISGVRDGEKVEISVMNTGKECDTGELNKYLEGYITKLVDSDGFGIKNVNERIKLNYGDSWGLSYKSNESGGVTATITLAYETGN